ncbi:hypothetical protein GPECTOR_17g839 [Gonium pectorale]|uniref:Uncharacterized protein n=1 Tax=Gonium pectorale TaxID=33097 RepID=A0A150GK83_GONPE|nr:hypothetical protein GPECTOR_17g839 [Gonium pectorale]|eukprot:KXZ50202.1 hypothetical protein GPECTOR_17g839 [Gonium pectorale]
MATVSPISPKGSETYADIKSKNYASKAKNLIYGGDETPDAPQNIGKKSVPHKGSGAAAPFATYAAEEASSGGKEFQLKPKTKDGAGKPTGATFDSDVYRQQIASNYANMQASKARNYGGNGVFN